MELDDENYVPDTADPQVGAAFRPTNCATCIFRDGKKCTKYDTLIIEAPVDIFDCPSYVDENKEKAKGLFGREL